MLILELCPQLYARQQIVAEPKERQLELYKTVLSLCISYFWHGPSHVPQTVAGFVS